MNAPYWSTQVPWGQVRETLDVMAVIGWEKEEAVALVAQLLEQGLPLFTVIPVEDQPALEAALALLWVMPSEKPRPRARTRPSSALREAVDKIQKLREKREKHEESPK